MSQSIWYQKAIPFLATLGILDSGYLTYTHVARVEAVCIGAGCGLVDASPYAEVIGIPVAALGMGSYLILLGLSLWEGQIADAHRDTLQLGIFGLALVGTLYSFYLIYLQLAVIDAICLWCLVSAGFMTGIWGISTLRIVR
ncbi:MAG: vitamin K epoxide reductase family protein [Candidatus Bipolaricaulia bacterium]